MKLLSQVVSRQAEAKTPKAILDFSRWLCAAEYLVVLDRLSYIFIFQNIQKAFRAFCDLETEFRAHALLGD